MSRRVIVENRYSTQNAKSHVISSRYFIRPGKQYKVGPLRLKDA